MSSKPVNDMLALLCSTFRCEIDSYQKRAYVRALNGIPCDVLLAAADRLIGASAAGRKFYPMPTAPDVKGAAAEVMKDRRTAAAARHLADCPHSSQYIYNPDTRVDERCPCWKRAHDAMQAVGQPIALPQSREDVRELEVP